MDISVLTMNIWGLPFGFSSDKPKRIKAICRALALSKYDIICLQEVWENKDYNSLKHNLKETHPYHHYFYSGLIGSGLCIFSRWLIEETFFYQFPMNGIFHMIHQGDWLGGKGVGLACINACGIKINVYNTHLHADYSETNKKDHYYVHRLIQAFDTALFIRHTSGSADVCVLGGDLNSNPDDLCLKLLCGLGHLMDTWDVATIKEAVPETNDCLRNSYRQKIHPPDFPGNRIDYILVKPVGLNQIDVIESVFPLEPRIPHSDISFSDHEAVLAKFRFHGHEVGSPARSPVHLPSFKEDGGILLKALETCRTEKSVLKREIRAFFFNIVFLIFFMLIVPHVLGDYFLMKLALFFAIICLCFQVALIVTRWLDLTWLKNAKKRLKVYVNNIDYSL